MTIDQPDLERLDRPPGGSPQNNSPNENIFLVQEIQCLASQIWKKLIEISATTDKQKSLLAMAKEEINLYETTTLRELQEEFE